MATVKPQEQTVQPAPGTVQTTETTTVVKRTTPAEPTKAYRFAPKVSGARHYDSDLNEVEVGSVVQLTKRQALAFADRFEPVNANDAWTPPPVRTFAGGRPMPNTDEPQDQSAKTPDPRIPPGPPANVPGATKVSE